MTRCLGILRERMNSPFREDDDAAILQSVLEELEHCGFTTERIAAERFDALRSPGYDVILPMCESYRRLKELQTVQARCSTGDAHSTLFINRPGAILRCYRAEMTAIFQRQPDFPFPPSEIRRVKAGGMRPPSGFPAPHGWWIKRGDVHNTCNADVVRLRAWEEIPNILRDFESRGILRFVVQPHLPGELIKFYGVGPGRWFTWFYHAPGNASARSFDVEELEGLANRAATSIGLEIFGGDAILTRDGSIFLIDINAWPSFALVRNEASRHIAAHIRARTEAKFVESRPL